jgi:hypothetical protein
MSKDIVYGILTEADIGACPSCHKIRMLPRGLELDELFRCKECGAQSKGHKWLADYGKSYADKIKKLRAAIEELDNDKAAEVQFQNVKSVENTQAESKEEI